MRVMTWNIWWRFGDRWRERHDAILATLAASRPDIVGLQEVWGTGPGANDARDLADKLGMHAVFAAPSLPPPPPGAQAGGGEVGIALLSRWPVASVDRHRFRSAHRPEEIATIVAVVDHPAGPLHVLVSCLDWEPGSTGPRRAQIRELTGMLHDPSRDGDLPVVLLADFNTSPDTPEMRDLTGTAVDAWAVAGTGPGITMSTTNPFTDAGEWQRNHRIDYVIVRPGRPGDAVHVERAELAGDVVDGVYPSDHFAVMADLTV